LLYLSEVDTDGLSLAQGGDDVRDSTGVEMQPMLHDLITGRAGGLGTPGSARGRGRRPLWAVTAI